MPIQVPVVQTGLEQSIQQAASKVGKNLRINMGPGARSVESLAKPLGRLTGKADEFTKSMEAANARVLAFGASVGVIAAVSNGLKELVSTTIQVEKSLANINSILKQSESQLNGFKDQIFDIARNTGQTFDTVAEAALELSRQGLKAEEVTKRLNDALILSRLSGLSAADSVAGLTAAVNSFSKAGLTTTDVLNKISAAAATAAVSDRDLIEGLKRSGSVAVAAGVQFDELIGIISALQERTSRGGAVIGNSLKTIFTRIQDLEKLETLQDLGVQVTDLSGQVLSSNKIIENLAPTFAKLDQASRVNLADNLVGKFQIAPFLALLEDYNLKVSRSGEVAATSFNATNEAYQRNEVLGQTLAATINTATVSLKELANALGEIGVTDSLKNIIGVFNSVVSNITDILDGDGVGSQFAKGLIKGISAVISGPGLALALVAIGKLLLDFAKFGTGALKTFFGLNKAAQDQAALQGQITASLLNDKGIRDAILSIEKQNISEGEKKKLQTAFFTKALNEQLAVMQKMQGIARTVAPGVMAGTASRRGGRAAGGFLPIGAESSDISKGVGGAPASAKPVVIPNFAFGGGRRGTMVANDSEYIVPNYANGGDAIFNQNMVSSIGLPANARKVRAASGYIPNFADVVNSQGKYVMMHAQKGGTNPQAKAYRHTDGRFNTTKKEGATEIRVPIYGLSEKHKGKDIDSFIKDLKDYSYNKAIKEAKIFSGGQMPNPIKQGSIKAKVNQGAVAGFAGSIYELAIATLLTDDEFLSYASQTDTSNFDLNLKGQNNLLNLYGINTKPSFGEVKGRNNPENIASAASKIYRVLVGGQSAQKSKLVGKKMSHNDAISLGLKSAGSRRGAYIIKTQDLPIINQSGKKFTTSGGIVSFNAASGYIPNFADPLQEAVDRERSAGLPISQIRINQSGKLRNAQNPMGLAVTNTRDEPTGAIPNFVSGAGIQQTNFKAFEEAAKSQNQVTKANRDYLGIIFGVQAGMTALSAATADAEGGLGKFVSILSDSLSSISSFAFAGQAASQLGNSLKESGGKFKRALGGAIGKLGVYGAALGAAVEVFKFGKNLYNEFTGENERAARALASLSDASKNLAINLDQLSGTEKTDISLKASEVVGFGYNQTMFTQNYGGSGLNNAGVTSFEREVSRGFTSDEVEKGFIKTTEKLLMLGKSTDEVDKMLDKFGKNLDAEELKEFTKGLKEANAEFVERKKRTSAILSGFSDAQLEGMAQGRAPDKYTGAELARLNIPESVRSQMAASELAMRRSKKDSAQQQLQSVGSTIKAREAKILLDTELKLAEIRLTALTQEEKNLALGKAKGELTRQQIRDAEKVIELNKVDQDLNKDIIGSIREQLSSVKGIVLSEEKVKALMSEISGLNGEILQDEEELKKVLNQVSGLTSDQKATYKNLVDLIIKGVDGLKEFSAETKNAKEEALDLENSIANIKDNFSDAAENVRHLSKMRSLSALSEVEASRSSLESEKQRLQRILSAGGLSRGESENLTRMQKENDLQLARLRMTTLEINYTEKLAKLRQRKEGESPEDKNKTQNEIEETEKDFLNQKQALENTLKRLEAQKNIVTAMEKANNELERLNKSSGASPAMKFEAQMRVSALTKFPDLTESEAVSRYRETMSAQEYRESRTLFDAEKSASDLGKKLVDASILFRENFSSAFAEGIQSVDSLKDALLNAANQFLQSITKSLVQNFTEQAAGQSSGGGGILAGIGRIFGFSDGGKVRGGSGSRDDVPAMLMGGEFVMNKRAVQRYGAGFMEALNSGSVRGYARGGQVRDEEGMFTTPGMRGAGPIVGGANLMSFATQTPVALGRDTLTSRGAFLGAESGRFTMFGRRNNPQFQKVQDAKRQAFDLAIRERQAYEQAEAQKVSLGSMLASAAISTLVGAGMTSVAGSMGFGEGVSKLIGSGVGNLSGILTTGAPASGGAFGAAAAGGELSNLFSGDNSRTSKDYFNVGGASSGTGSPSMPQADSDSGGRSLFYYLNPNNFSRRATGGLIPAAGGVDTVPAMLSGGEFVMNAAATRNIGAGNLQALNSGAGVGNNTDLVSKLDELIIATETSQSTGDINITINGSTGAESQTGGQEATESQRQLSEKIKVAVKQVIADEQRLGGQLRR